MPSIAATILFSHAFPFYRRVSQALGSQLSAGSVPDWLHPVFRLSSVSSSCQHRLCPHLFNCKQHATSCQRFSVPVTGVNFAALFLDFAITCRSSGCCHVFPYVSLGLRARCYKFSLDSWYLTGSLLLHPCGLFPWVLWSSDPCRPALQQEICGFQLVGMDTVASGKHTPEERAPARGHLPWLSRSCWHFCLASESWRGSFVEKWHDSSQTWSEWGF